MGTAPSLSYHNTSQSANTNNQIYPPELFPLRVRGKAVSITTAANRMFNFALGHFTPPSFENIKWKTYLIFGVFSFCMAVHAFLAFPETAGKALEEVEDMFVAKIPAWKTSTDTKRILAWGHGDVDPEKVTAFRHAEVVPTKVGGGGAGETNVETMTPAAPVTE
jgi:hypothetical protein